MRKMMSKEVAFTNILASEIVVEDGKPVAVVLPPVTLMGAVSMEKAQKEMNKIYKGKQPHIYSLEVVNETFEMAVEDFIKHATKKEQTK